MSRPPTAATIHCSRRANHIPGRPSHRPNDIPENFEGIVRRHSGSSKYRLLSFLSQTEPPTRAPTLLSKQKPHQAHHARGRRRRTKSKTRYCIMTCTTLHRLSERVLRLSKSLAPQSAAIGTLVEKAIYHEGIGLPFGPGQGFPLAMADFTAEQLLPPRKSYDRCLQHNPSSKDQPVLSVVEASGGGPSWRPEDPVSFDPYLQLPTALVLW